VQDFGIFNIRLFLRWRVDSVCVCWVLCLRTLKQFCWGYVSNIMPMVQAWPWPGLNP